MKYIIYLNNKNNIKIIKIIYILNKDLIRILIYKEDINNKL